MLFLFRKRKEKSHSNEKKGWIGEPKGIRQVLWETGWINTSLPKTSYTLKGKKDQRDDDGNILDRYKEYSLTYLISNRPDFKQEKSALEYLAEQLSNDNYNIYITLSTPYHPELAGEGIEYVWGLWKKIYRHIPFHMKKGLEGFHKCINQALSSITVDHVRKFSAKARRYMLAYLHFNEMKRVDTIDDPTYVEIEKLVKTCKAHRNTQDQETGYISKLWKQAMGG